jgi:hypothetical protein
MIDPSQSVVGRTIFLTVGLKKYGIRKTRVLKETLKYLVCLDVTLPLNTGSVGEIYYERKECFRTLLEAKAHCASELLRMRLELRQKQAMEVNTIDQLQARIEAYSDTKPILATLPIKTGRVEKRRLVKPTRKKSSDR